MTAERSERQVCAASVGRLLHHGIIFAGSDLSAFLSLSLSLLLYTFRDLVETLKDSSRDERPDDAG